MTELFKTVLILSVFGFVITVVLLCLKPITAKKFSARWQYYMWILVLAAMIVPVYKLIPEKEARKINTITPVYNFEIPEFNVTVEDIPVDTPQAQIEEKISKPDINLFELSAYIWILGVFVYLFAVTLSYIVYIIKKRKNSVILEYTEAIYEEKRELGIKRKIRVRISGDTSSPMLVGVLFPTVYIPAREIPTDNMRMVFLHELMHYKRKDLLIKWLSLFVNAVHWFNPIAYLLRANISEACEIACDMAVTKNMSEENRKLYMKTILDLVEEAK